MSSCAQADPWSKSRAAQYIKSNDDVLLLIRLSSSALEL